MGIGRRLGMTVVMAVVFAVVMGAMWYVVVPGMYGAQQSSVDPQGLVDGASSVLDGAAEGIDGAVAGLEGAADGLEEVVGGLGGAADELGGAAEELGDVAEDIGSAVSDVLPGAEEPAGSAGGPEWIEVNEAEPGSIGTPEAEVYYVRNDTGFKETLTHRYVMYPPCAAVLDGMGMETRTIFGFPTPIPQDSGARLGPLKAFDPNHLASEGFSPKTCSFDYNGDGLGDGWEDNNGDGYADGFTDCTKPYVFQDGWYVRELGRDCKYGAPAARAAGSTAQTGTAAQQSGGYDDEPSGENVIPYATARTGTMTRVIDGDTIVVDGDVRIRLALVDTPERGEPGYEEASAFTRSKCPAGTTVVYDVDDGQRDGSYGRVIALVWCVGYGSTGTQAASPLNAMLVDKGHAEIDRRFCTASEFGDDEWALRGGC